MIQWHTFLFKYFEKKYAASKLTLLIGNGLKDVASYIILKFGQVENIWIHQALIFQYK